VTAATETNLSPECTLARRPGYEKVHGWCRRTEDIPLPYSNGIVLVARCCCACHQQQPEGTS
jgi:hypothetical protein